MNKKYRIILCVYCGDIIKEEETWETDEFIDTGTCGRCYDQLKNNVNLKQLYKIKGNRIIKVVE